MPQGPTGSLIESIRSGIVVFAAGDALGVPWEGEPPNEIDKALVELLPARRDWPRGATSDDTAQLLLAAEAVAGAQAQAPERLFLERLTCSFAEIRGTGPTTRAAVRRWSTTGELYASGGNTNGAAMRAPAIGWGSPAEDDAGRRDLALRISRTTHGGGGALLGASVVAALASWSLQGMDVSEMVEGAALEAEVVARELDAEAAAEMVVRAANGAWLPPEQGVPFTAVETVAAVLHTLTQAPQLPQAMIFAVGLGGDTDTVAAIVGGILGCRSEDAASTVPWLEDVLLPESSVLDELAAGLARCRRQANAPGTMKPGTTRPAANEGEPRDQRWLTPGVRGIGAASLLADAGHEIPTALLPTFLTSTLAAPASALGLIEGVSDGLAGVSRLAGGALADDPHRRRATAVGGYASTAVLSALIGAASTAWQAGVLRATAWASRGLRVPARNALLADAVPASAYGRAYGFERAMDNLGAVIGPLLALGLVGLVGVRTAILLSVIPGLLAVGAIVYAIRNTARPKERVRRPVRLRVRPVLRGDLGRLLAAISVFELGNIAATLLILRATDLLEPGRTIDSATQIAIFLYVLYNVAATLTSVPASRLGDVRTPTFVLGLGVAAFAVAYAGFALVGASIVLLGAFFVIAGIGIGAVETAEHAAVATHAPEQIRGSSFGVLAGVQSFGNFAASSVAGILYAAVSPTASFLFPAAAMVGALILLLLGSREEGRSLPRRS